MEKIILIVCMIIIMAYIFTAWSVIKPNEIGWRTFFGSYGKALKPGLHFTPYFIAKVIKYEQTPLIFKFKISSAMTKNGIAKGYKEDGGEIERTDLDIFVTLTTYFDEKNLGRTAANAPGADARSLGSAIEPFIVGIFRSIAAEMPWPLLNGERTNVEDYVLSKIVPNYEYRKVKFKLTSDKKSNIYFFSPGKKSVGEDLAAMLTKNPIVQFGLDTNRTSIDIEDINFSNPELANKLNLAEEARLQGESDRIANGILVQNMKEKGQAEADIIVIQGDANAKKIKTEGFSQAEANAEIISKEGIAMAEARKLMIAEIKDNPSLEYLHTLSEMAKGISNTILYQIPKGFEEKASTIMGGSKPEDFFAILKDPKIVEALKEALEKITK